MVPPPSTNNASGNNSNTSNTLPVPAAASSSPRPMHQVQPVAGPSSYRFGASPSFGGGMSIDKSYGKSYRMGGMSMGMGGGSSGAPPGSFGAKFYAVPHESPGFTSFGNSVNMDGGMSFVASSAAFGLPGASMSSSFRGGRSYAAAARGDRDFNPDGLSSSFASMSFRPGASMGMSFGGNSYSKSQVHSLMNNRARTDAELTRTYECCGETHKGLHELLEHVEDVHPFDEPMDGAGGYPQPGAGIGGGAEGIAPHQQIGFSPQVLAMDLELEQPEMSALGTIGEEQPPPRGGSQRSSLSPMVVPSMPSYPVPKSGTTSKAPTPPGENPTSPPPLQISDILTSPFTDSFLAASRSPSGVGMPGIGANANANVNGTSANRSKSTSSSSSPPDGSIRTPTTSQQPSPVFNVPKVNPARVGGFLGTAARPSPGRFDRAFNEVVAGNHNGASSPSDGASKDQPTAVAPGMLFASAVAGLGIPTAPPVPGQKAGTAAPPPSTVAGAIPGAGAAAGGPGADGAKVGEGQTGTAGTDGQAASGANGPAGANGNMPSIGGMTGMMGIGGTGDMPQPSLFTTHKPWRCPNPGCNKAYKQSNGLKYHQQKGQCDFAIHDAVDLGLSLEEAEERSRPFVCAVGAGCTKRYRQMNGLKYHYLNSGEHGKYGLRMLQNGTHPQPSGVAALAKKPTPTFTPTRPGAAPYQIPSQLGQTRPTGHMAGAAPSQGQPQGQGQHSAFNGSNGGAGPVRPGGGFGSNGNGTTGPGGPHGLPRMGIFPTNSNNNSNLNSGNGSSMQNRPMPGSGAPGSSHMQTQNRPVPGSVAPGGPSGFNGGLNRPGMPIRTNGSGPTSGSGIGGPGASQGQAQKQNGAGAGAGAGSGGPLSGGNNGVSSFARPAVGQIPPHRPGQPPHSQGGQQQQQQQGRPGNLQMSGFPPLRASQPAQSNINQQNRPAQQLGSNSNSNIQIPKSATVPNEPPVQRGRDAVLFAAVETMDL